MEVVLRPANSIIVDKWIEQRLRVGGFLRQNREKKGLIYPQISTKAIKERAPVRMRFFSRISSYSSLRALNKRGKWERVKQ